MDKFVLKLPRLSEADPLKSQVASRKEGARCKLPLQRSHFLKRCRQGGNVCSFDIEGKLPIKLCQYYFKHYLRTFHQVATCEQSPRRMRAGYLTSLFIDGVENFRAIQTILRTEQVPCVEFNASGNLIASTNSLGDFSIHKHRDLCISSQGSRESGVDPVAHSWTQLSRTKALKWDPMVPDQVASVSADSNAVYFHPFPRGAFGSPKTIPHRGAASSGRVGLLDLAFDWSNPSRVMACGQQGRVLVWDRRSQKAACSSMQAPSISGSLNCLQLSPDGQVAYAGSAQGSIHAWDLRGGRQAATAFCGAQEVFHQALHVLPLAHLFSTLPTLQQQAGVEVSGVQSISFDPSDASRLGFHLNNGWSGAVDLGTQKLTHAHCPPPPWSSAEEGDGSQPLSQSAAMAMGHRRRPAWLAPHSVFCVPSGSEQKLLLLDFGASSALRTADSDPLAESSSALVEVSEEVIAVTAHPTLDHLVASTAAGSLLLLDSGRRTQQ